MIITCNRSVHYAGAKFVGSLLALLKSLAQISSESHYPFQSLKRSLIPLVQKHDLLHLNLQNSTRMIGHFQHTQIETSEMAQQINCCLWWMGSEQVVLQVSAHRETHLAVFHRSHLSTIDIHIIKVK